jgi:hypothetical protein
MAELGADIVYGRNGVHIYRLPGQYAYAEVCLGGPRERLFCSAAETAVCVCGAANSPSSHGKNVRTMATFSRICPVMRVCRSATPMEVIDALDEAGLSLGLPHTIRVDPGSQFASKKLHLWAYAKSRPQSIDKPPGHLLRPTRLTEREAERSNQRGVLGGLTLDVSIKFNRRHVECLHAHFCELISHARRLRCRSNQRAQALNDSARSFYRCKSADPEQIINVGKALFRKGWSLWKSRHALSSTYGQRAQSMVLDERQC